MGKKTKLKLGSMKGDFQLIDPKSMTKITGGRKPGTRRGGNSCGGIMPS